MHFGKTPVSSVREGFAQTLNGTSISIVGIGHSVSDMFSGLQTVTEGILMVS